MLIKMDNNLFGTKQTPSPDRVFSFHKRKLGSFNCKESVFILPFQKDISNKQGNWLGHENSNYEKALFSGKIQYY